MSTETRKFKCPKCGDVVEVELNSLIQCDCGAEYAALPECEVVNEGDDNEDNKI